MPLTIRFAMLAVALGLGSAQALAQGGPPPPCMVSTSNLVFGAYLSTADVASTANIDVNCAPGINFTIELSQGGGTFVDRKMAGPPGQTISYNLYKQASYIEIWGDGTQAGANPVPGMGNGALQMFTVFGLIPASQRRAAGPYSDTIVVTIRF